MRYEVQKKLVGVQAILVTPFRENGDVDYDGLERNIDAVINAGARFITCTGNCGEFSALTVEELEEVARVTCSAAAGRGVAVAPGVGSASLRTLVHMCDAAEKAGADAVLVPPPFHGAASFEQCMEFFRALSRETSVKMEFYYYPDMHRMVLSPIQMAELLRLPCFAAVKETANLIPAHAMLRELVGEDVNIISGTGEFHVPDAVMLGEQGFISTMINYAPSIPLKMWEAASSGQLEKASEMRKALAPLFIQMQRGYSIATMKALMEARSLAGGPVRLPLLNGPRDKETVKAILNIVESIEADPLFS